MSNEQAEIITPARGVDQAVTAPAAANIDVLALHREATAMAAPAAPLLVADNQVTPAVYHPGENGAHLVEAQYHAPARDFGHNGYRRDYGAAVAGALLFDSLAAPYSDYYPAAPLVCVPPRYYGGLPYCYNAEPVLPLHGFGLYHRPERAYEYPRAYERLHR